MLTGYNINDHFINTNTTYLRIELSSSNAASLDLLLVSWHRKDPDVRGTVLCAYPLNCHDSSLLDRINFHNTLERRVDRLNTLWRKRRPLQRLRQTATGLQSQYSV